MPKIADCGVQCMMVGYSTNHTGDCYKMWDPNTGRIHSTRDTIWLKRMYFLKHYLIPELAPSCGDIIIDTNVNQDLSTLEAREGNPVDYGVETANKTVNKTDEDEDNIDNAKTTTDEGDLPAPIDPNARTNQSDQTVKTPERLIKEMNAAANNYKITSRRQLLCHDEGTQRIWSHWSWHWRRIYKHFGTSCDEVG